MAGRRERRRACWSPAPGSWGARWRRRSSPTASSATGWWASSTTTARGGATLACRCSARSTRRPRCGRAATQADQVYIALPLEEHARLVPLLRRLSNECVDIKVVPDLVQYATIQAALEDLDGIPIISLNEVPLRGWSSMVKRADGRRGLRRGPARSDRRPGAARARAARSAQGRQGARASAPGAHDARRKDVPDLQVPHRCATTPRRTRARSCGLGRRSAPHADRRLAAPPQPRRAAAAPERAPRRHEPRRPAPRAAAVRRSSSASGSRSTCCATASRAGSPAGRR